MHIGDVVEVIEVVGRDELEYLALTGEPVEEPTAIGAGVPDQPDQPDLPELIVAG